MIRAERTWPPRGNRASPTPKAASLTRKSTRPTPRSASPTPRLLAFTSASEGGIIGGPTGILKSIIAVTVLVRFGLLAQVVFLFTLSVVGAAPLTLDSSAWYAGRSFATLLFFAVALLGAAHATLAGKPAFGHPLLED